MSLQNQISAADTQYFSNASSTLFHRSVLILPPAHQSGFFFFSGLTGFHLFPSIPTVFLSRLR